DRSRGWALTFRLLRRMDEVSRGLGARLVLVALPGPLQTDAEALRDHLDLRDLEEGTCDPLLPGRRVCELASSIGAPCLDLLPELQAGGSDRSPYWSSNLALSE